MSEKYVAQQVSTFCVCRRCIIYSNPLKGIQFFHGICVNSEHHFFDQRKLDDGFEYQYTMKIDHIWAKHSDELAIDYTSLSREYFVFQSFFRLVFEDLDPNCISDHHMLRV